MIKTKSLFDRVEESDGKRIVVSYKLPSRHYCSTYDTSWEVVLAPFPRTVKGWHKKQLTWEEYTLLYLDKMTSLHSIESINRLAKLSLTKTLTLLCYEKEDDPHCHRHLLKALIDQATDELGQNKDNKARSKG